MESELSYNTRVYDKDPKYTDCEDCDGVGFNYVYDSDIPEDRQLIKEVCKRCEGSGVLEIK
jgi:hypothetical protein